MSCFVQYAPTQLARTTWEAAKPGVANTVLDTIQEYAPNIRKVVRNWQVVSPADIESVLGMTGGNIFQGDITPDQIFTFRPVPGWSQVPDARSRSVSRGLGRASRGGRSGGPWTQRRPGDS